MRPYYLTWRNYGTLTLYILCIGLFAMNAYTYFLLGLVEWGMFSLCVMVIISKLLGDLLISFWKN